MLRAANLTLKFLIELAAFAALAYWGATTASGLLAVVLAVVAAGVAIGLWAVLAAPRSERRLPAAARIPFELAVFGVAVLALLGAGATTAALILAALVVVNAALLTILGQWEH